MANGGKLLIRRLQGGKEDSKFNVKVRRKLDIGTDVWQRMVPGMVGSVNYGSGRRAYDQRKPWPERPEPALARPAGSLVYVLRVGQSQACGRCDYTGTDAHHHLPAAVAGGFIVS